MSYRRRVEVITRIVLRQIPLGIAATLMIAGVALNFANVIARYFFRAPIFWAEEAMIYMIIWSIFLAAIAVTYDRADLTMDFFSARVSHGLRRATDAVLTLISVSTFLFIAWESFWLDQMLWRNNQKSLALEIPMVIPQASLLVGFTLLAVVVAVRFALRAPMKRPPAADDISAHI
jgi:TRAP-type C4-dicarboxylate transport system permease small subunit